jgi:pyruvate ferredoxin oxidoreductase gamma subunit
MSNMVEIRWHARGGQGAKTAAMLMAEVAMHQGKFAQGFPEYGPERAGAPIKGYTRISDKPILVHSAITNPSVVIVLDETLLDAIDVTEGIQKDGILIINTKRAPEEVRGKLCSSCVKVGTVDATQISLDTIKRPIPNTPMMGALVKMVPSLTIEGVLEGILHKLGKKLSPEMMEGNKNAVKRAFEEVKIA